MAKKKDWLIIDWYNSDIKENMLSLTTREDLNKWQGMGIRKDAKVITEAIFTGTKKVMPNGYTAKIYAGSQGEVYAVYADRSASKG